MEHTTLVQRWGDGVDRYQWQMKGDGGRENNEQTRLASDCRSMRRLFFRADTINI